MTTIRIKHPNGIIENAELCPGCFKIHRSGRGRGTAHSMNNGKAWRVEKRNPKATFWMVTGDAR